MYWRFKARAQQILRRLKREPTLKRWNASGRAIEAEQALGGHVDVASVNHRAADTGHSLSRNDSVGRQRHDPGQASPEGVPESSHDEGPHQGRQGHLELDNKLKKLRCRNRSLRGRVAAPCQASCKLVAAARSLARPTPAWPRSRPSAPAPPGIGCRKRKPRLPITARTALVGVRAHCKNRIRLALGSSQG